MASIQFCEDKNDGWIQEYYNTLSSLSYIITALPFLHTNVKNVAWSGVWIGIGSVLLHGTGTYWGQCVDEISIIFMIFYIFQYNFRFLSEKILIPLVVLYFMYNRAFIYFFSFVVMNSLFFLIQAMKIGNFYMKGASFFIIMASIIWMCDQFLCSYVKYWQMHAWWHILSSISFGLLYKGLIMNKMKDK
tara:strand:- start:7 stop:573 length:567 start_codon:yes stop_codon:yes gene_type:complete